MTMEHKDRKSLKEYFRKGNIPTEEQFAELIDSVPNIADDGQAVRTADGWALYPETGNTLRIHLHESENTPAAWTLCLTSGKGLAVINAQAETIVELGQDRSVTMTGKKPEKGSGGSMAPTETEGGYVTVNADSKWHDLMAIPDGDKGLRLYRVFMFMYDPDTGKGREVHATAIYTGTTECRIRPEKHHWWSMTGCMRLRWHGQDGTMCLQIRSRREHYSHKILCRIM